MRVVVAPDKFKGSLTAAQVADRVAAGLIRAAPGVEVVKVPAVSRWWSWPTCRDCAGFLAGA